MMDAEEILYHKCLRFCDVYTDVLIAKVQLQAAERYGSFDCSYMEHEFEYKRKHLTHVFEQLKEAILEVDDLLEGV